MHTNENNKQFKFNINSNFSETEFFAFKLQWNAEIRTSSDFRRLIIIRFEIVQILDVRLIDLNQLERLDFERFY